MSGLGRTVDILGHKFQVSEESLGPDLAGDSNATDLRIRINYGLPDAIRVETFYHEVVHMMLDVSGYSGLLDPKLEEAIVQYLGHALAQFVSVNGSLPVIDKEGT